MPVSIASQVSGAQGGQTKVKTKGQKTRHIASQVSGAQGGQTSTKTKKNRPLIFPLSPPPGTGTGAHGGEQFRAPVSGSGRGLPRDIVDPGIGSVDASRRAAESRGADPNFQTQAQAFDSNLPPTLTGDSFAATGAGLGGNDEKGPSVIYNPQTQSFEQTGVSTQATDPLANNEIVDPNASEVTTGTTEPSTGSVSIGAQDQLSEYGLRDNVDTAALRTWINGLVGAGFVVNEIREVRQPDGTVKFEALEYDPVTGTSSVVGTTYATISPLDDQAARLAEGRFNLETERLELDRETQETQLRIQEELARIDQDIARDRIQNEQEIATGNWQNSLDIQDRIDERERASRQLERDLFNANQELQNRRFELDRAQFDLEKLEFFQSLSLSPANFADIFNITRGLAPTGAGGPLPQGIQRIGQPSDVQQTAAQDVRTNGINLGVNAPSGALPQVAAEGAVPQFNPEQTQLSFLNGQDPTPVGTNGQPLPAEGQFAPVPGAGGGDPADQPTINPTMNPTPVTGFHSAENMAENEGASFANAGITPPVSNFSTFGPESLQGGGSGVSGGTGFEADAGAPLPIGLQMAFANQTQQLGAPQTPQNSIPLLSPQTLAMLSPAEREAYFALAQMQGQYRPDFEALLAARGGSQQVSGSQRVFA